MLTLDRAVRGADDDAFFSQINEDRIGYMNSNGSNIRLPGPSDAERFRKSMDDNLISAIICLPEKVTAPVLQLCLNIAFNAYMLTVRAVEGADQERAGTPIGQVHLSGSSIRMAHHRNTEIGIDILPAYQGKGYGSEAIRWVLEYAFKRAGLHKVRIRAFGWNEGACRLYQRLGFVLEGTEREALWHEGRFWDGLEFGMVDREWWALQEAEKQKDTVL
ncbi:hypothetical protein N0V90_004657 [Kalmusia sp. IMI 367209]|nr:hypothetical protein N0V90_004657 [Kalmusia sp. IMI 367209]